MMKKIFAWILVASFLVTGWGGAAAAFYPEEEWVMDLFKNASPSVAFIKNATLQWDWFSFNVYEVPQGVGSGFVWDTEGHVVTNFHVIYQADKIEVALPGSEKMFKAKVKGIAPDYDLAVLKIDAPSDLLKPITRGISDNLRVGQSVLAIGNPFGLDHSLTTGVVSALGRSIQSLTGRTIHDVVQTDAAINPGNSGGPLLDSSGRLIGVSTSIYSPSGVSAGVGFAIPVEVVNRVVPELIEHGRIKSVGLGVTLVSDIIRRRLGVYGAIVLKVIPGSAAEQVGFEPTRRLSSGAIVLGDVIIAADGRTVRNNRELIVLVGEKRVGESVRITYLRDQQVFEATLVIEEIP